ncbi:MAG: putative transporter permease/ATP-binding protein [Acidimicrobiales bacterium]|nr:putative transporter permease/ATP-binding protein [Acidimicrobiales bacterium]
MAQASETQGGRRLLLAQLRTQRRPLIIGIILGLFWTAAKVAVPLLLSAAIDRSDEGSGSLVSWALLIAGLGVVAALASASRRYLAFREARWAETDIRNRLFAHVQRLHFGYHDRAQTGQLMSRANTDLQQVQAFVVMIPITITNLTVVLAAAAVMLVIDVRLAVLAMGCIPLVVVFARRFQSRLHPAMVHIQQESAELASVVEETVSGIRIVKGFGAEPVQAERLREEADDVYDAGMEAARIRARWFPALELLPNIGLVVILGYGGHLVLDGRLTVGQLVAFNVYLALLVWPLRMLGMVVASAERAVTSAERVHEILSIAPSIVDPASPRNLPPPTGAVGQVRFEGVTFAYGRGRPVLDGLDLVLEAGTSVALVGATGSGKTTLARLIPRFYDPAGGRVLVDGVDVRDLGLRELRRNVATVFEETFLFSDTIAGNIGFGDPGADQSAVGRAARLAGAHDFISALPDGYDTEIGERGFSLSGGQRQRIAIARAVLTEPRVLILDDATSAVDPSKEHEIREGLDDVLAGRTTIVIAHRPATIALADSVVLLDEGRVAATGTHRQLLRTNTRYRQILTAAAEAADAEDVAS